MKQTQYHLNTHTDTDDETVDVTLTESIPELREAVTISFNLKDTDAAEAFINDLTGVLRKHVSGARLCRLELIGEADEATAHAHEQGWT